jgi:hypothetical protein
MNLLGSIFRTSGALVFIRDLYIVGRTLLLYITPKCTATAASHSIEWYVLTLHVINRHISKAVFTFFVAQPFYRSPLESLSNRLGWSSLLLPLLWLMSMHCQRAATARDALRTGRLLFRPCLPFPPGLTMSFCFVDASGASGAARLPSLISAVTTAPSSSHGTSTAEGVVCSLTWDEPSVFPPLIKLYNF